MAILFVGLGGARSIAIAINTTLMLMVTAVDANGSNVATAGPYEFVSRNSAVVTVDSVGLIAARSAGAAFVVAKLIAGGRTLSDSVKVTVGIPASP